MIVGARGLRVAPGDGDTLPFDGCEGAMVSVNPGCKSSCLVGSWFKRLLDQEALEESAKDWLTY